MDIMKPIASEEIPYGKEWLYEVKYDGFRCVLHWEKDSIQLMSRNKKDLTASFPEIVTYCQAQYPHVSSFLPLKFDGELVVLNNAFQANFSWIQKRGRLKKTESIMKAAEARPASFMAFDILQQAGISYVNKSYENRKSVLTSLFYKFHWDKQLQLVQASENPNELWETIFNYMGEGMIAKRKQSLYNSGKSHHDWFKIKNWRTIQGFLTDFHVKNEYFTFHVYNKEESVEIGKCKHGLPPEDFQTLKNLFLEKGDYRDGVHKLPPAICAAVNTLDLYKSELREPEFVSLLPHVSPSECTIEKLGIDMAMFPENVDLTNTEKVFWPESGLTKGDLLVYIREMAPYMIPFMNERVLTIIRSPDGVEGEYFFQKHLPDYAPSFINSVLSEDKEKLIICDELNALIWFANHGAVEYHLPFQRAGSIHPIEVVFDLDPPDRERFGLAIDAAILIKRLLDDLELLSFVKTSGNKGLQIHIPLVEGSLTYDDTALFTQAIAYTVEGAHPDLFTTERMKKKRKERLYIDYVQHGKDKTIIAPYSTRKTREATVAAPLYWEEVTHALRPEQFTIENVAERVKTAGCPFTNYFAAGKEQNLKEVLRLIRS
ncbi:DNA ligase D [Virgibacillus sp. C22-A2]|uniref:DNA ligase (ATP) n=1 Tax=Virgibacillus tibetensis TaxID=3042313 RepID=A0ABU6KH16_9BACI|nr:DNA ligase D [Virgibacillus sp. C22-A2]